MWGQPHKRIHSMTERTPLIVYALVFLTAAMMLTGRHSYAANPTPFKDDIAQRTQACTACHGNQGRAAPDGYYPRLAGKPAGYLYNQLLHFKEGRRHYGLMTQLVDPLSNAYLMEIAQYFAQIKAPYAAPVKSNVPAGLLAAGERLVMQGDPSRQIPACIQCHGQAMTGVLPSTPGLLGLPRDYVNSQLGAWKTGQRRAHAPDCMKAVVAQLTDADINAASSWLAAQVVPADSGPVATRPPLPAGARRVDCGSAVLPTATTPDMR